MNVLREIYIKNKIDKIQNHSCFLVDVPLQASCVSRCRLSKSLPSIVMSFYFARQRIQKLPKIYECLRIKTAVYRPTESKSNALSRHYDLLLVFTSF